MSMMRCYGCAGLIDTDNDVEGLFEDAKPYRFWCSQCVEEADNDDMLSALKAQEPERFAEIMS